MRFRQEQEEMWGAFMESRKPKEVKETKKKILKEDHGSFPDSMLQMPVGELLSSLETSDPQAYGAIEDALRSIQGDEDLDYDEFELDISDEDEPVLDHRREGQYEDEDEDDEIPDM